MPFSVEERWRALWEISPQRSPFSRLEFLRAAAGAAGLDLNVHFVDSEGLDTAGAAVTWRKRGPYRTVILPPYTPFSALLLRESTAASDVHARSSPFGAILRELERNYDAIQLHLHPSIVDVRPAIWRDWAAHPLYTYIFPLDDGSGIVERWSSSAARNYKTARDGYELYEGTEAAAAAIRLSVDSYARHGRSAPLSKDALATLIDGTKELSTAYAVRRLDETRRTDAAVIVVADAGRAYYWIAGSLPGNAMTVLVGELLARLSTKERTFDFVGANTPSIAEFKRRFGCTLETYYRIVFYGRRDLRFLYMFREFLGA